MSSEVLSELAEALGLGDLPSSILNSENLHLHEQLISKQSALRRWQEDREVAAEDAVRLHSHLQSVAQTTADAKRYLRARRSELVSEEGLVTRGRLLRERCGNDSRAQVAASESLESEVRGLSERIESRSLMVDLLDEEFQQDLDVLHEWTENVEDYEENILELLRCQNEDANKIKVRRDKEWHSY